MSTKMNQKEAVKQALVNVCGESETYAPTKEQRAQINMILCAGFVAGHIELKDTPSNRDKIANPAKMSSYVSGLISNWLRKDEDLNGGVKYVAKNPGSRAGSGDPMLKSLRALFSTLTTDADKAEVQGYIDARIAEIATTKQAATVDFSALPADLQAKYSK